MIFPSEEPNPGRLNKQQSYNIIHKKLCYIVVNVEAFHGNLATVGFLSR